MSKVIALNCPSCGAPLSDDSPACDFCGARLRISEDRTKVVLAGIACPECGSDNAPSRRFCGKCGTKLVERCTICGEPNRVGVQFCGGCGLELAESRRIAARKARKLVAEKLAEEAVENGWRRLPEPRARHYELYKKVASPEETCIVFVGRPHCETKLYEQASGRRSATAFIATDQSFMFLNPGGLGLLPTGRHVARRVPFDEVNSLEADLERPGLLISFEGGDARVDLAVRKGHKVPWKRDNRTQVCHDAARGLVYYFKPFLPPQLQQGW